MYWSDCNGSGVTVKGRVIVKGNVYIIGTELVCSDMCNHPPAYYPNLIPTRVLGEQVPSSAKTIFAGTAPSPFSEETGLQWTNTNLVELNDLYTTGEIYSMAPTRTLTQDLTPENALKCIPDPRQPDTADGSVVNFDITTTPGVLKNATHRTATLPS